jgi:hypothetical protein
MSGFLIPTDQAIDQFDRSYDGVMTTRMPFVARYACKLKKR